MGKEKVTQEEAKVLKPEIVETPAEVVVNEEVVLTPKLTEIPTVEDTSDLKFGECIVEIISGPDKDKTFKTTLGTAKKYYSNEEVYKILKKN